MNGQRAKIHYDVVVVGLGFVGLPALTMFAKSGLKVAGIDSSSERLAQLKNGKEALGEPDFDELFISVRDQIDFYDVQHMVAGKTYVLAVPTPLHPTQKRADLTLLHDATRTVSEVYSSGELLIVESTIPPKTCSGLILSALVAGAGVSPDEALIAHCPERLYPGNVLFEIINNDRIIGGLTPEATKLAVNLYSHFAKGELYETDAITAEFCKLVENTYRDVNIALANELQLVSEKLGTNVRNAIELANFHPRVNVLSPGIGVGGHCLPIDPWFLSEVAPDETVLISTARRINDAMPGKVAAKIRRVVHNVGATRIGLYGVTYKPDVGDERESPSWTIIEELESEGYEICVFDPISHSSTVQSFSEFVAQVNVVFVLVEHSEIKQILGKMKREFDPKGALDFVVYENQRFYLFG